MAEFQFIKQRVRAFHDLIDAASVREVKDALAEFTTPEFQWRGMHPFNLQRGAEAVADTFWRPLKQAVTSIQRRPDVFIAGRNDTDGSTSEWVCSMGHLMGLFDRPWLGIPPTGKLLFLRYAEINRVVDGQISESALFCDIIGIMRQAGLNPLPYQTGAFVVSPGPRTHDGLMYDAQPTAESEKTLALINQLIADLTTDYVKTSETRLARCWQDDMAWFGPAGIGATYTRERYRQQHQDPFRSGLKDIEFQGHVCRIAEGHFGGFFGWPNLKMKPAGGFLGLPASDLVSEMRVVDFYRRDGDKLAENWIIIDLLHFLHGLGVDLLPA